MISAVKSRSRQHVWALRRRLFVIIFLGVLSPAAGLGLWLGGLQLSGNLQVVEPGVVYRSAQLGGKSLREAIDSYGIKSIINLRGASLDEPWYRSELAIAQMHGVQHFDFALSANSKVDIDRIGQLLVLMRSAPKPLLIHCKGGADRSGLAAAIFEYAVMLRTPEQSAEQLSLWYGHFPYLWSRTGAMDDSFRAFVRSRPSN